MWHAFIHAFIHRTYGISSSGAKSLTMALAVLAIANSHSDQAVAQQDLSLREQLVGTWTLTDLNAVTWDEDDRNPFGPAPTGRMIFDRNGNVTCVIIGAVRPSFALGERLSGTAAENRAVVQSTQAFYGTYSVDEDNKTVTFHVERSLFPNWDGTVQLSVMTINGNQLDQTKAGPRSSWGYAVWQRVIEGRLAQNE